MHPTTSLAAHPLVNALAGLLALAVAMGIGRFAFTPVLPLMLDDASLTLAQGGLLASANYAGYLLGALSAIVLRIRPESAIRGGLAAIALTTLAMSWRGSFAAWFAMRLLAGVASAWILISVSAWSLETLARFRRPLLGGAVFAGVGAGIAFAGLACIFLLRQGAGSAAAWTALGWISAAVTLLVWPVFRRSPEQASSTRAGPAHEWRWTGDALRLVFCYGAYGFGYIIPATFLPVMARQALQDPTLFAWSWPVFGAAAAVSTLAAGLLMRALSSRRLWLLCHLVMAVGVILPALQSGAASVFLAALLVGGTFMVVTLAAVQEARLVAGERAPVLIAAMTSAFAAGQIAGPLSITYVFGRDGDFSAALVAAALVLAISALLLYPSRQSAALVKETP